MRNTSKMTTLENKFPLLAVEHGCIISKDADITVAFEVELPELYTVTGAEYEAIHGCWCKAVKVLPDFSVVHKQDWFIKERYKPELDKDGMSFLSRSFERHFNERPYLKHTCYPVSYTHLDVYKRQSSGCGFSEICTTGFSTFICGGRKVRKPSMPKSDASQRTIPLPHFITAILKEIYCQAFEDAFFLTNTSSGHHPLLHDHSRGLPAGHGSRNDLHRQSNLRFRYG